MTGATIGYEALKWRRWDDGWGFAVSDFGRLCGSGASFTSGGFLVLLDLR